jgi:hypothetical protein
MSQAMELHRLPDGTPVSTGLLMPTEAQQLVMANVAEYPDKMYMEDKDIERLLVVNGQPRFKVDRKRRQKRMRNQSRLGKCNASSNASGVENTRDNQGMPHVALSDCHLYSKINDGRDSGSALIESFTEVQAGGISPMEVQVGGMMRVMPNDVFNRRNFDPAVLKQADIEAKRFMGFEFYKAPMDSFEKYARALASAIARGHQVIFAWHVGSGSMRIDGNGYAVVGRGAGNHSNVLHSGKWVGGKSLVHPDDQNSWGPSVDLLYGPTGGQGWGEGGFALFTMEDVFACARNHCTYIITSVKADPNDPAFQ